MRISRRELPIIVGGFAGGFLIAIGLVYLWVTLTTGSSTTVALSAPNATTDTSGLISYTYGNIAKRLNAERKTVRKSRGDLSFRATRITWQDARRPDFARVGEIRGIINASTASSGNIVVRGAVLSNADIYVEQTTARGEWNYQRVLARLKPEDSGGPKKLFVINDLAVRNTRVRVNTADRDFVIDDLAAQIPRVDLSGPNLAAPRAQVARATAILAMNNERHPIAVTGARLQFPESGTEFNIASLTTGETRISNLEGTFGGNIPGIGLRAIGRADNVRFEDIRFVSPRLPATGVASFDFGVRPLSETRTEIVLSGGSVRTEGSNVRGSATIIYGGGKAEVVAVDARFDPLNLALVEQLMGDTLPYQGTITGTARGSNGLINFDVNTRLTSADLRTPFLTHLTGSAFFSEAGFELRRLDADLREVPLLALRAVMPGLPLSGTISGRVSLTGSPDRSPLALNVRLELALGVAIVEGTVDLRGAEPSYDLTGRLLAVNLNELIEPEVPPVFVSANFTVNGRGKSPETMVARIHLDGRFTGWRAGPGDSIHADVGLRGGTVTIDTAAIKLASMTAQARGSWRFVAPASGAIAYDVVFASLTPFGPYIPGIGNDDAAGSMRITGTASGPSGRLLFAGDASGTDVRVGGWGATEIESKYRLVIGPAVPEVQVNATAANLRTPTAGAYTSATASVNLVSPAFTLDVKAERAGAGGGLEIYADGRIPPTGAREVIMHRARLELGAEQWTLMNPAVFAWSSERNSPVMIRNLDFREVDGPGRVMIDGRVRPPASADFRVETVSFPVDELQRLLGMQPRVAGELALNASVLVTAGVPRITGRFQLDSAVVQDISFSSLTGDIEYANDRLVTTARAVVDTAGALDLRAELPLDLRFGDSTVIRMRDTGPVRITLISDSIALAPFAVLSNEVENVTGRLTANVLVTGTVQSPQLSGTLALRNASAHIVRADETYDSINAVLSLQNQRATIQQFVARSGGLATGTGTIEFADLNRPVFNLTVRLAGFRVAGIEGQEPAKADGEVHLNGPMDGAVATGDVTLSDGYFPVPTVFTSPLDEDLAALAAPGAAATNRPPPPSFVENLRVNNFRVRAGEDLWFAMPDARAQMSGELVFDKIGDDIRLTGTLSGTRGQYTLRAGPIVRRFDVVEAQVRFLGDTDINPLINIVASRVIVDAQGRQLDLRVRVGGTMRAPTLSLASADAANIPQSELLSFLLFGQSNVGLDNGLGSGQALVTETFLGGLTELLSLQLEDELVDAGLGVDIFQLRFGNSIASLTEPSLIIGEEFADNWFITVETGIGALFGGGGEGSGLGGVSVRLEWRINPTSTLRLGYEVVHPGRALRGVTVAQPLLITNQERQFTFDFKKRWSW